MQSDTNQKQWDETKSYLSLSQYSNSEVLADNDYSENSYVDYVFPVNP